MGRLPDGRVVFVPFSAPGDLLRVRIVEERARFVRGTLVEVLEPGPGRTRPRCSAFGECGGCSWQHLDYAIQLDAKAQILRDALQRIGRVHLPEVHIVGSPRPYRYRQRTRVVRDRYGVGYRGRRSHRIRVVTECPVLVESLETALRAMPPLEEDESRERGATDVEEWELVASRSTPPRVHPVPRDPASPAWDPELRAVELQVGVDRLAISPGVFVQANAPLFEPVAEAVVRAAQCGEGESAEARGGDVLELFAGAGYLTLGLSRAFARVRAVESNPAAVADLRENLTCAGCSNVEVISGSADSALVEMGAFRPDVVVLDPPRTGLGLVVAEALAKLGASRIVYLSCDPATLARDVGVLCGAGYRVESVLGFDFFPQTPHVEALVVLEAIPARADEPGGGQGSMSPWRSA